MEHFDIGPFKFNYDQFEERLGVVPANGVIEVWLAQAGDLEEAKVAAAKWAVPKFSAWIRDALNLVT